MREYLRTFYVVAEDRERIPDWEGLDNLADALLKLRELEQDRLDHTPDEEPWKLFQIIETRDVTEIPYRSLL